MKKIGLHIDHWLEKVNKLNWSSLPILIATATLVFTYQHSAFERDKSQFERTKNYLKAVQVELDLMTAWANPTYHDASLASYMGENQHFKWYDPSSSLYSFPYFNIHDSLSNPSNFVLDPQLLTVLINLDVSIQRLFEVQTHQSEFAFAYPDLYERGALWFHEMKKKYPRIEEQIDKKYFQVIFADIDARLVRYLAAIYTYNYDMHVCSIGGEERVLADCGPQKTGINALWKKAVSLTDEAYQRLKPPLLRSYLLLFWAIVLWFFVPSLYSFIARKLFRKAKRH